MSCPHGHGNPAHCSQCLGIRVARSPIRLGVNHKLYNSAVYASHPSTQRCRKCKKHGHRTADCKGIL